MAVSAPVRVDEPSECWLTPVHGLIMQLVRVAECSSVFLDRFRVIACFKERVALEPQLLATLTLVYRLCHAVESTQYTLQNNDPAGKIDRSRARSLRGPLFAGEAF